MCKHLEMGDGIRYNEVFHFHSHFHIREHTRSYFFQELLTISALQIPVSPLIKVSLGLLSTIFCHWEQIKLVWFLTLSLRPICFSGRAAVWIAPSVLLPLAQDITMLSSGFIRDVHLCLPRQRTLFLCWDEQPAQDKKLRCCRNVAGPASKCHWSQTQNHRRPCPSQQEII